MADTELEIVLSSLKQGRFQTPGHCRERMADRGVTMEDIRSAARTAYSATRQSNGRYRIDGYDRDGEKLRVIATYDGQTVVVTVY